MENNNMSAGPKNLLALNRNKPILERLTAIEDAINALVTDREDLGKSIQSTVDKLQFVNGKTAEVVEAVITALGADFKPKIDEAAKANDKARKERIAALQSAQVAELVANNKLKSVTEVSDKSLIVGRELDANNEVIHPGRAEILFSEVDPAIQTELKGKTVGYMLEAKNSTKFEVTEIYEAVESSANTNEVEAAS